ncbi:serine protease [Porticoccaceae bacterium]|nr:serine protease [Porticoccaceae bacterium]
MIRKLFLLILLFFSPVSQSAIFGDGDPSNGIEDQRHLASSPFLKAVGTIFCDGGLRGTATHISTSLKKGPAIILTAAHVLFDEKTGLAFRHCAYRPENRRLSEIDFAAVSKHQYQFFSKNKIRQSETDIVFVALKKKPYQESLSLAVAINSSKDNLQLLGYNMDSQEINLSNNCESFESEFFVSEQLLLHNCDALGGSSGGPIISTTEDGEARNVIAVHGGTLSSGISGGKSFSAGRPAGAKVNPEQWINQARKIDRAMLIQLQQFLAYLAKDFPSQK